MAAELGAEAGDRETRCRWRPGWGPEGGGGGLCLGGNSGDGVEDVA